MPKEIKSDKLSSADVAWLRMGEPTNRMVVVGLLALGDPMSVAQLKTLLAERLLVFERFAQRLDSNRRPRWLTDTNFDLDDHVRVVHLPPPGGRAQLERLTGMLMSTPLDLAKAPWDAHLIENYGDGSVVAMRIHHSIADGIALVQVLLSLADEHFGLLDRSALPEYGRPADSGGSVKRTLESMGRAMRSLGGSVRGGVKEATQRPLVLADWAQTAAYAGMSALRIALLPADSATRFKAGVGVEKRAAWSLPIPLADVRAAGRATGAKVNDVLLSSVAGGLRRYLTGKGEPVAGVEFGAVIPVNVRPAGKALELGNRIGVVFLRLPLGIEDPAERLVEVQRRMDRLKISGEALVALTIIKAAGLGPMPLHRLIVRILSSKTSAVITNVPGPTERLHLDGNPITEVMYWVPRGGEIGLGISIISYAENILFGVATDAAMAPDPSAIIAAIRDDFEALRADEVAEPDSLPGFSISEIYRER
jgi:diacylglycerol O-acyltransferase / wax synthase